MSEDLLKKPVETNGADIIALTSEIVSAYVGNNTVKSADLPTIIRDVHTSLTSLSHAKSLAGGQQPAVPINQSITDDYLICLEDGKEFKSLKRHLRSRYQMTPDQYREKWGLPYDYPMVAPAYARQRSELAKQMGLGQGKGG